MSRHILKSLPPRSTSGLSSQRSRTLPCSKLSTIRRNPICLIGAILHSVAIAELKGCRYNVSKLLEVYYGRELATRCSKSNKPEVIINFVNPGLCHSALSREAPFLLEVMKFFLARSTEVGSRTLVHAVEAEPDTHGQYLSSCHVTQ